MSAHHGSSEARCQARGAAAAGSPPARYGPDRPIEVSHIALDLDVDLAGRSLRGSVRHDLRVAADALEVFALDAVALTIDSVTADGRPVAFSHDGERVTIRPSSPWKRGESHQLLVVYHGAPVRGMHFVGPDEAYPDKPLQAWTQGQDEDARFWFPCADYPNQKSTTEIRARVPRGFEAVSNGKLARREDRGDVTEFHWVQDVPHVTYLVSLAIGRFDVVLDRAGKTALRYLVPPGAGGDARRTFGRTPRMIETFERLFGHPYPWTKYDQVVVTDFLCGGMENTSATTLFEWTMLDETVEDAVDRDDLISHELAHQWFGDLITCRGWAHAWLNEGFATYSEVLWYEHGESRDRGAWHLLLAARSYFDEARDEYRRPIVTHAYEAPADIFDRHLYEKAACVIHQLRGELGDEPFFRGLRRFVKDHAGGLVDTRDLRAAFEAESGRNLEPFFDQWIYRQGHPEIEVTESFDPEARRLTIEVRQTQEDAAERPWRFRLPFRVWLEDRGAAPLDRAFEVTDARHAFAWTLPGDPAAMRPARASLPLVRVKFQRPDSWLARQLEEDDDVIGRIDAAAGLGRSATDAAVSALAGRLLREPAWMAQGEIAKALADARGARARDALVAGMRVRNPRARAMIVDALGRFRDDGVAAKALEDLLEDEKAPLVRAAALHALGASRAGSAAAILTKALWDPSWNEVIGRSCLEGLGLLRDRALVPLFVNSFRRGEHELRRVAAVEALRATSEALEARTPVREQLEVLLEDRAYRVVQSAVRGLRSLGDPAAIPALERLAARRHGDTRVRRAARNAVSAIQESAAAKTRGGSSERIERLETELRKLRDRVAAIEDRPAPASRPAASRKPPARPPAGKSARKPAVRRRRRRS
jgi:aminopeptidase N